MVRVTQTLSLTVHFEEAGNGAIAVYLNRPSGSDEIFRCFRFSLRDHTVVNLSLVAFQNDCVIYVTEYLY